VHYRPVIDQFPTIPALDPPSLLLFAIVFCVSILATLRRPSWSVAILAFITPLTFYHDFLGTQITLPKAAILGAMVGLFSGREIPRMAPAARAILIAFLAILVAIMASAVGADYRSFAAREFLKWVEYAFFFAAVYYGYRFDPNPRLIRVALFLSIALVCVSALAQEIIGAPFGIWIGDHPAPRISGFLEGPNQLAAYLEVAIAAIGGWQIRRPSRLQAVLLALAAITFCLTFSRGAAIGILSIAAVFFVVARATSLQGLVPMGVGIALGMLADGAWVLALKSHFAAVVVRSDLASGDVGGLGTRSELWRAALFFFQRHPLFGIGAGNYELELAQAGLYGVRTHANNWYLQALAEGGIVLFAATIAWIVTVLSGLRKYLQDPWALGAFAATIALVVHQVFDYLVFYPKIGEPLIVLIALGVAAPQATPPCD
jgi:O-antigen ligase